MSLTLHPTKLPNISCIIGVVSGKGGVGKTFVASNLALTFAKLGNKVGLLDADIACSNIFKVLGIKAKLTPTADNKIIPIEKWGMKIVSMAGLTGSEDEPVVWRGPIISKILQQLLKESIWGELDVLVIDFPTGTGDVALTILQNFAVDGVIIVTTPQELATIDARKAVNMANMLKVPVLGVIENMRGDIFGEGGGSRTAEYARAPLLGSIPLRKQIVGFCDAGMPPLMQMEEVEMLFSRIARAVIEKVVVE